MNVLPIQTSIRYRPIIRLFVSSTFSDLMAERNALARDVFPKLEHHCALRGFQFEAIDLRWGVPSEAGRDHRTMRICFEELRRAQDVSPRPNFLVLLGDRYGWQPLAEWADENEFGKLTEAAVELDNNALRDPQSPDSASQVLATWYRRDNNACPVRFLLRSRFDWPAPTPATDAEEETAWKEIEATLWAVVNRAFPPEDLADRFAHSPIPGAPLPSIVKFQASATEQEIWRGALALPEASKHVVAWRRAIINRSDFEGDDRLWNFFDKDERVSQHVQSLCRELESRLRDAGCNLVQPTHASLCRSANNEQLEVTTDHLTQLCEVIELSLRSIIDEEIEEYWHPKARGTEASKIKSADKHATGGPLDARKLELENQAHERFGKERAPKDGFIGRKQELDRIAAYLADTENRKPLIVHGPSGSGKTALLARAAQLATTRHPGLVIQRYLGTMPDSSNLHSLLTNLCSTLSPGSHRDLPLETRLLQEEFDRLLNLATFQAPILLFLDAIDQLDEADGARGAYWLRTPLPEHVRVVVSCLRNEDTTESPDPLNVSFRSFERRKLLDGAIDMDALTEDEALHAIDMWLSHPQHGEQQRRLSTAQREAVRARVDSDAACRMPLYLRILAEEARLWPSWKEVKLDDLGANTSKLLGAMFSRLEGKTVHGPRLVTASMGYLAAARRGLSQNEILEVLWADEDYRRHLEDQSRETNHGLPEEATRIPIAIWSRLRHDLAPYLAERDAPGATVLGFYHRIVGCVVTERFLQTALSCHRTHRHLAGYFQSRLQPWWRELDSANPAITLTSKRQPNSRKVDELPRQWLWAVEKSDSQLEASISSARLAIEELFQCLAFLEAKAAAGMISDLVTDFTDAIHAVKQEQPGFRTLQLLLRALRRDASAIALRPHLLLQSLWHSCYWYDSPRAVRNYKSARPEAHPEVTFPWDEPGPKLHALIERWLQDSRSDGLCRQPWLRTLRPSGIPLSSPLESILRGHTGAVRSIAVNNDGRLLASGSDDGTVRLWDCGNALEKAVFRGHTAEVTGVAISSDGSLIASASRDKTVRIWDAETLTEVGVLRASWRSEKSVGGGAYLNTLTLAQYTIPEDVNALSTVRHGGFTSVAMTPDGRRIVCGSEDDIRIWHSPFCDHLTTTYEDVWWVSSISITEDGNGCVSNGVFKSLYLDKPREVLVWDLNQKTTASALGWDRKKQRTAALRADLSPIVGVTVTPNGKYIVSGSQNGYIRLWRCGEGTESFLLKGHDKTIIGVSVTPDGKRIVSASEDKTVRVWNTESRSELFALKGHEGGVTCCAISADGSVVFSGSMDRTVRIWSLRDNGQVEAQNEYDTQNAPKKYDNAIAYLPDGRRVEVEFETGIVAVWDADSRILQTVIPVNPRYQGVSIDTHGRDLALYAPDETVVYALDISTHRRRRKAVKRTLQSGLRRICGVKHEDTAFVAPAAGRARFDLAEYILQNILSWIFGVRADDALFDSTLTPVAEFSWPGCVVRLSDSRKEAMAISLVSKVAIPCAIEGLRSGPIQESDSE